MSPEEIQPFPKAPERKERKGGRKKGKTQIVTDTPVKQILEEAIRKRSRNKTAGVTKKRQKKSSEPPAKRRLVVSSSDSETEDETLSLVCNDDSDDLEDEGELHTALIEHVERDFILTKFPTKKSILMYVGKIEEQLTSEDSDFQVRLLRHERPTLLKFMYAEAEDISDVVIDDVVAKLPKPLTEGGTARVERHLSFPVDFSKYSTVLR